MPSAAPGSSSWRCPALAAPPGASRPALRHARAIVSITPIYTPAIPAPHARVPAARRRGRPGQTPIAPEELVLSVLVPVYNECATLEAIIERVHEVPVRMEIICVDDCSTDGTWDVLRRLHAQGRIHRLLRHPVNRGKGAAIRSALSASTGNVVLVQDADLEYDPADWPALLEPILEGRADAVFGSRFLSGPHRVLYYWHSVGNRVLTTLSNMFTNLNLTDMETCYKAMRGELARGLVLTSERFGFEPELTARLAQARARIYEVPISYAGRTYAEGKKINWKDGVAALRHIVHYNVVRPREAPMVRHAAVEVAREPEAPPAALRVSA